MEYANVRQAVFLRRPNRFIAVCLLDGSETVCHVKNTGRCRELLTEGCTVYLSKAENPARKTKYDLIAVQKGELLINMDSGAPNAVFGEFLRAGGLLTKTSLVRPEKTYKSSRFDFYAEHGDGRKALIEVKGVTLEEDGVLLFPDAPTERGVKHLEELIDAKRAGFDAYIVFVVQTHRAKYFTPNRRTHPAFAEALVRAQAAGVQVLCYSCRVTPSTLQIDKPVEIRL